MEEHVPGEVPPTRWRMVCEACEHRLRGARVVSQSISRHLAEDNLPRHGNTL